MQYEALLRGTNFRPIEAKVRVQELTEGHVLTLEREPYNEHDSNAIKVIDPESEIFLGYVAKEVACELAPEMDAGMFVSCKTGMKMPQKTGFGWTLDIETRLGEEIESTSIYDEPVND